MFDVLQSLCSGRVNMSCSCFRVEIGGGGGGGGEVGQGGGLVIITKILFTIVLVSLIRIKKPSKLLMINAMCQLYQLPPLSFTCRNQNVHPYSTFNNITVIQ